VRAAAGAEQAETVVAQEEESAGGAVVEMGEGRVEEKEGAKEEAVMVGVESELSRSHA